MINSMNIMTKTKETITIKEILRDNYDRFKKEIWYRVQKDMRNHIDANLRCISKNDIFNIDATSGMSYILLGDQTIDQCIKGDKLHIY